MIAESFIDRLKEANTIEDVISSYIQLSRRGRYLKGLCPFHSEKTPSFTVYPENGSYYCFGCGSGGDVITFVRNIENLEYIEALRLLAGRAGLALPEDSGDDRAARMKTRVYELNRKAARFFHSCLKGPVGAEARAYLSGRALTAKTITRFGLGFAPESWDNLRNHLRAKGFSEEEMLTAAVVTRGRQGSVYDTFRGRVIFPIIDLRGNVIGFGGRAMSEHGPKYLNSADTPVFKKSRNLFALNFAKSTKQDTMLLAEGYMDVISIHQAGFDNAVATLGTSLTAEQARLLSGYTKKAAIAYDSDAAGQAATRRAINLLGETGMTVSVLEIKGAKDPDEYIKKFGAERFGSLISSGKGALDYEIQKIRIKYDLDSAEGKSSFLSEFCRFIAEIEGELQRDVYISMIARELDVGKDVLEATVRGLRKKRRSSQTRKSAHNLRVYAQDKAGTKPRSNAGLRGFVAEEKLITLLLLHPDLYEEVRQRLQPEDFVAEENRALYTVLSERLQEQRSIEPIHLSGRLSPPLMARLTGLLAAGQEQQLHPQQLTEFCGAILEQRITPTKEDIVNDYDDAMKKLLDQKKKK